jgi:5-oxoprolinase (ATP-hydrolysing) subunit A
MGTILRGPLADFVSIADIARVKNQYSIDLNADLGEGTGLDHLLMPLITSCSIACGGHYGDSETMRQALGLARRYGLKSGAHPSYPDRVHFGRIVPDMSAHDLRQSLVHQILAYYEASAAERVPVNHIKLHGALYNRAATETDTARTVIQALDFVADKTAADPGNSAQSAATDSYRTTQGNPEAQQPLVASLNASITTPHVADNTPPSWRPALYLPDGSVLASLAANRYPIHYEAFIDRRYNDDGTLVSRTIPGAVISDPVEAFDQLEGMVLRGEIRTISGRHIPCRASTFCVHGDSPGALDILKHLHHRLGSIGITLRK